MSNILRFPGLDAHLTAHVDRDDPEPTDSDRAAALGLLIDQGNYLSDYVVEECDDPVSVLRALQRARAETIPQALRDAADKFFGDYEAWLEKQSPRPLDHLSEVVAEQRRMNARIEAGYRP